MKKKRQSKKRKKKVNPLAVFILGTALMLAGNWSYQLLKTDQMMETKKKELIEQKNLLAQQNEQLRSNIEKLNTPSYIEQQAREKLGLVRKGEILIAPKEAN